MLLSWLPVALLAAAVLLGLRGLFSRLVVEPQRRPDPLGERLRANALVQGEVPESRLETLVLQRESSGAFQLLGTPRPVEHRALPEGALLSCWCARPPESREATRGTAIMLHGFSDGSHRLARAASVAINNDWVSLLVDLPGHGLSPGVHATFGRDEVPMLEGLLGQLRAHPVRYPPPHVFVGYSYGASMSIATILRFADRAAQPGGDGRKHPAIAGAILAAPYWDLRATMHRHAARYLGLSAPKLINDSIALGERRIGFDVDQMGPRAWLRQTNTSRSPLPRAIVLRGEHDSLLLEEEAQQMTAAWHAAADSDPGCRLVTLPDLHHDGVWEAQCTLGALPDWLDWLVSDSASPTAGTWDGETTSNDRK